MTDHRPDEPESDRELMLRVKEGEVNLMGTLFRRHGQHMYAYFVRHIGSTEDARDLLQRLFERMLKYRKSFRGEAKFSTWMYQAAINLKNDHYRERDRERRKSEAWSGMREFATTPGSDAFADEEEEEIRRAILEAAFRKLEDSEREILVLGKYQGLRYRVIGEVLGCSEGAVKVRMHRALGKLRNHCQTIAEKWNYDI